jgi:drug/metabolite transporter (DMT)-like permease
MPRFSAAATRLLAYGALTAMPFLFSVNMVIGRAAGPAMGPWTLAFWRWVIASAILVFLARNDIRRHAGAYLKHLPLFAFIGFIALWLCGGMVYVALSHTTATNGALIYATTAIFILLFDWLFNGRRIGRRDVAGVVICLAGVVTIIGQGSLAVLAGLHFNIGDLLFAAATIGWAGYSLLLKRPAINALPSLATLAVFAALGTVMLAPFAVWEMIGAGGPPARALDWLAILGVALIPSVAAFSAFQFGLKVLGAPTVGMFTYLLLPAGVLMAWLFLGEHLEGYHAVGSVLIMGGILIATLPIGLLRRAA